MTKHIHTSKIFTDVISETTHEVKRTPDRHFYEREIINGKAGRWNKINKNTYNDIMEMSFEFRQLAKHCVTESLQVPNNQGLDFAGGQWLASMVDAMHRQQSENTICDYHLDALISFSEKRQKENMFQFLENHLAKLLEKYMKPKENLNGSQQSSSNSNNESRYQAV